MKHYFLLLGVLLISSCKDNQALLPNANSLVITNPTHNFEAIAGEIVNTGQCSTLPTLLEVQNQEMVVYEKFLSAEKAVSLNIPVVNANGAHNLTVYVRDYKRSKTCETDLISKQYGYLFRSVIEIESFESSVESNLPSLAANGTLKNKRQSFYFYKTGFNNKEIDNIMADVAGKVFNVENYALFQDVTTKILKLLSDSTTTFSITEIGQINKSENIYFDSPIISFAMYQISKGKKCQEAKQKFINDTKATSLIEDTYAFIIGKCSDESPSDMHKLKAKGYLNKLTIK